MKQSWVKILQKTISRHAFLLTVLLSFGVFILGVRDESLANLLASAASAISGTSSTVYFTPYSDDGLKVGEVSSIDINVNAGIPINAVGMTVRFPHDMLEIVGISKQKSFLDLWTEDTVIKEELGEVHFSGGTLKAGGVEGVGTALTLSVRARKPGNATLSFSDIEVLADDGKATPLKNTAHSYTYEIMGAPAVTVSGTSPKSTATAKPQAPSPDLDGNGKVNFVDASILMLHIFSPYDARFDLDMDGRVGLADISIIFGKF